MTMNAEDSTFKPELGDYVKISFDGESMWLKITDIRPSPIWEGVLDNHPVISLKHKYGDIIDFEVAEVIQYMKGK